MATPADWLEGARLRTLPAAIAPVLAGSAIAWHEGGFHAGLAGLALLVGLALQVGVNYANDYSDGIRGTDANRVGPMRLVGSGAATPAQVKWAAFGCFGVAGVAGLLLVALTGFWWLLGVGAAAILAAWYYTGGKRPYGYLGLGEVFVFIFFGLVAVAGTIYVQLGQVPVAGWWTAVSIGALACAILVANNLRDLNGDLAAGKRTLATRLGDQGTRWFYLGLTTVAVLGFAVVAWLTAPQALWAWLLLPVLTRALRAVPTGASGPALIPVLKATGIAELVAAAGLFAGLVMAG